MNQQRWAARIETAAQLMLAERALETVTGRSDCCPAGERAVRRNPAFPES
ncbi:MAG: hypothetical protein LAP38_24525 [Acidobacteriia bacterium]|nr:hypothetical protein [Terriglobia bacterium]